MNKKNRNYNTLNFLPLAAFFCIPLLIDNYYWKSVFVLILINVLLVASLRTVKLIGYISLGQVGFAAVGAYGSALLVMKAGFPFWLAIIAAGLLSGLMALVLGYPFLKTKGMYFAILSILTAETIRNILYYCQFTGGSMGLTSIPAFGVVKINNVIIDLGTINNHYLVTLFIVVICLAVLFRLEYSSLNFRWQAICDDENLARSIGFNVAFYKIINFSISCFFAGVAGALLAFYQGNLSADYGSMFGVLTSIYLIVYLAIGGESSFFGPIVGTIVMVLLGEFTRPLKEFQNLLIGSMAIIIMIFVPDGITGILGALQGWIKKRRPKNLGLLAFHQAIRK